MIRKRLMTEINLASLKSKENFQSIFYSEDFQDILLNTLEQKYGGPYRSHRAAKIIQQAYRQYRLKQKLSSSGFFESKSVHCRNNSMPDNLHFMNYGNGFRNSNGCLDNPSNGCQPMRNLKSSKIKDSLSLLLPELQTGSMTRSSYSESSNTETDNLGLQEPILDGSQYKFGDILSTKCEEDLENFQSGSVKTDSTDDSDSCSDKMPSLGHDNPIILKLPPPMPVISTGILSLKPDRPKTKTKLFSFDKSTTYGEQENASTKSVMTSRVSISSNSTIHHTRSPRDSGVSSHSSNTDLLTFESPGLPLGDNGRYHNINSLYSPRPQSAFNSSTGKGHILALQMSVPKDVYSEHDSLAESSIPPITEDNDSLFESAAQPIPSVMTSSKDSGVDADSGSGVSNQPNHLRRFSFQDRPMYWKLFHRQSCVTKCVLTSSIVPTPEKETNDGIIPSSPWMKHSVEEVEPSASVNSSDTEYKDMVNRVLYRVAVNLFNRNTTVGLKFMEDHSIFNVRCPIEIANFLRSREVNLQVLADFLSCRNSVFHLQVLRCFLQNMALQNLSFLEAFDMFISSFKLPEDSIKINYLIAQFCQYYTRHVQRCAGVDLGALMGLSRVIILLKSSVVKSRLILSSSSVLSFSDFVKNVQNCFKGQHIPYNMEMLQKIYISITRSNGDHNDVAESLINRIGNIDECKSKSIGDTSEMGKVPLCRGYLHQAHRRLTYCCDVQQCELFGKKLKKNEHLRSIFVFNDTAIVAKRLTRASSRQSRLFRTDSKFQCKIIINLLTHRVTKTTCPSAPYQIRIDRSGDLSRDLTGVRQSLFLICDSEASRDKLLAKVQISQMESQCVEQLRLQQWHCVHDLTSRCLCLSVITASLPKTAHLI